MPARSVLMVEPVGFAPNKLTADDNAFQTHEGFDADEAQESARGEFQKLADLLKSAGIDVQSFSGSADSPDAVFPNNWFSTHEDHRLVLYPMRAESRRLEKSTAAGDWLKTKYENVVDLSSREERGDYLEGTGSLVLDRQNKIAYAALSGRTSERALKFWCAHMGYEPLTFETIDRGGLPVYHTNVVMSLGTGWAVLCDECIPRPAPVISSILGSGREIIEITRAQMAGFCGNIIELQGSEGPVIAMSQTAFESFTSDQRRRLSDHGQILSSPIPTIERFGGGSVRCMIAELY